MVSERRQLFSILSLRAVMHAATVSLRGPPTALSRPKPKLKSHHKLCVLKETQWDMEAVERWYIEAPGT